MATVVTVSGTAGVVCPRCLVADTPWLRLRGLLGRASLDDDEGLLLRRSGSIHMFFMRFAIDAVFLDRDDVVVGISPRVRPWRVAMSRGARSVLELPAGAAAQRGLEVGVPLTIDTPVIP